MAISLHVGEKIQKKKRQLGAGREINFDKADTQTRLKLTHTRKNEWNNWKQFQAVDVVKPEHVNKFLAEHPELQVLPTRWVDTDKAEVGQESKLKSRLVVRGDMETSEGLRTEPYSISALPQHHHLLCGQQGNSTPCWRHLCSLLARHWHQALAGDVVTKRGNSRS